MGAKPQTIYYPASSVDAVCKACYAGKEESDGCKPKNGSSQNTSKLCGSCNVTCNSKQAYCSIGHELITSHGNVGNFSGFGVKENDIIQDKWTIDKWIELQDLYLTANKMGVGIKDSERPSISFTTPQKGQAYTASLYNEFSKAAQIFRSSIPTVNPNDIITVARSTALETGFNNGKFNQGVCDICNTGTQNDCGYNCSCNYNCNHNCNYNCKYDCSYDCSHNCNKNESSSS